MTHQSLFVNHQLNYDEAVRRLVYWVSDDKPSTHIRVSILAKLLADNRQNLYFENQNKSGH